MPKWRCNSVVVSTTWVTLLLFVSIFDQIVTGQQTKEDYTDRGGTGIKPEQVKNWADQLGEQLYELGKDITMVSEIEREYNKGLTGQAYETYDPEVEMDEMQRNVENYMRNRSQLAWKAKQSLEMHDWIPENLLTPVDYLNDQKSDKMVRYINAKTGDDDTMLPNHVAGGEYDHINKTRTLKYRPNVNFYGINVSLESSAVHVPVPVYDRNPEVLRKIDWSDIDTFYRKNKERIRDLAWQYFCSEAGFLRYYPAKKWVTDDALVDLFDCRNTEWFLDGATNAKNIIILLDISGSMLGQRFEIAKQTIETILDTLSENDFFNIMPFSNDVHYFTDCLNGSLVQATKRNKLMMRNFIREDNEKVAVQGIAVYTKALEAAFSTLLGYNATANWTSAAWIKKHGMPPKDHCVIFEKTLEGDVMCLDENYIKAIEDVDIKGCNQAIMLITDGASDNYRKLLGKLNKDGKGPVRFFSYLIGEEATQFKEVEDMACRNNGFMVQVANLADAQEKVQHYIRVMSRPIEYNPDLVTEDTPVWTGVYMDRLFWHPRVKLMTFNSPAEGIMTESRTVRKRTVQELKMVTTVSYPVVRSLSDDERKLDMYKDRNSTNVFMGVAGVAVPMIELQQMAPIFRLGANAYTFLIDNNGAAMFHPQLRPFILDRTAGHVTEKPNYNGIDIADLENDRAETINGTMKEHPDPEMIRYRDNETMSVDDSERLKYDKELRKAVVSGSNSRSRLSKFTRPVLLAFPAYALDDRIQRVYEQQNTYYYRPIKETLFSIVLANPQSSTLRLKIPTISYSQMKKDWVIGTQFKMHPEWRYCMMNDTDFDTTKEDAFIVYYKQMIASGALPDLCVQRKKLVDHMLYDVEKTAFVTNPNSGWKSKTDLISKYRINLIFMVTHSGYMRFVDKLQPDIVYNDPSWEPPPENASKSDPRWGPPENYAHFTKRYDRGPDEPFYHAAMQYHWMYPCPKTNKRNAAGATTRECEPLFHFNVTSDTRVFYKNPQKPKTSAYGTDETSSLLVSAFRPMFLLDNPNSPRNSRRAPIGVVGYEMLYDEFARLVQQNVPECENDEKHMNPNMNLKCYLLDDSGYVVYSSDRNLTYETPFRFRQEAFHRIRWPLGRFYGAISAVENSIMWGLVNQGFYKQQFFMDYQAVCEYTETTAAATRLLNPFLSILRFLIWFFRELILLLTDYSFWAIIYGMFKPAAGYTPTFTFMDTTIACDKGAYFYTLNQDEGTLNGKPLPLKEAEIPLDGAVKPCGQRDCSAYAAVSLVPYTNMLLVIQWSRGPDCMNDMLCRKEAWADVKTQHRVNFTFEKVVNASDKETPGAAKDEESGICNAVKDRFRRQPEKCWQKPQGGDGQGYDCSRTPHQLLPSRWLLTVMYCVICSLLLSAMPGANHILADIYDIR